MEAAENQPNQYTNELNTLAGEAFLPLDEILKGYGVAVTPDCRVERCSSPVSIGPGESDKEQADTGEKGKHDSSFLEDMEQELESCKDERADNATAALFDPGGRSGEPSVPSKPQTGQSGSLNMQFANSATGLQVLLDEKDDSDGEFLADMMDTDDLMVSICALSCSTLISPSTFKCSMVAASALCVQYTDLQVTINVCITYCSIRSIFLCR